MWWIGIAMAQDVVVDDFTGPTLDWTLGPGASFAVPPTPWSGAALACAVDPVTLTCEAQSGEFVVTHDTIRYLSTSEPVAGGDELTLTLVDAAGGSPAPLVGGSHPVPGTWGPVEIPIVDGCGLSGAVHLSAASSPYQPVPTVYFDDLALEGTVCSQFVDLDGDGACLQGTDDDLDGLCITPGEALGPGVVVDPDEAPPDTGTAETGDTGVETPTTTGHSGIAVDTGSTPGTDTGATDTSDTGAATPTTSETPPAHTGEAPVHDPWDDDTGGVYGKDGTCACGTSTPRGFASMGLILALVTIRRRR